MGRRYCMIEVKLQEIADNIELLNDFAKQKLPAATAYKAARILKLITEEYNLYQQSRTNLIDKYCERDENGNMKVEGNNAIIQKDKVDECNAELQQLLDTTVELNAKKLSIKELDGLEFTPGQMALFSVFIDENE